MVGRLIPIKGHDILLEALVEVRTVIPEVTLEVAGDGPLEGELAATVARLDLSDHVTFLGRVAQPAPVFERAELVVVPSLGEGFGMVALEAMERGRPVIASDVGGLPEIVADGETGLVVPSGDADALAEAMVALAGDLDRARAMGLAGRERALAEFTPERSAQRIEELYAGALADGASAERRLP